jgi:soluble lytic murein transglycosylase
MGARGIMQIMPEVGRAIAREVGLREDSGYDAFRPEHLDDPVLNIKLGIYYLYGLKKIFRSLNHALVAYNVGPTAMRDHLENETDVPIEFANAVLSVYRKYQPPRQPAF